MTVSVPASMEQQLTQILHAVLAQNQQAHDQTAALARIVESNTQQITQLQQAQALQTAALYTALCRHAAVTQLQAQSGIK